MHARQLPIFATLATLLEGFPVNCAALRLIAAFPSLLASPRMRWVPLAASGDVPLVRTTSQSAS